MQKQNLSMLAEETVRQHKTTLETAFNVWPGDNSSYSASQALYMALRAILGREEDPSVYPEDHPLLEHAKTVLVDTMRGQMQSIEKELTVFVTAFLYMSLHRNNWKAFTASTTDKQLYACVLSSFSTESKDVLNRICDIVTEWSGTPFNPNSQTYTRDISERLFGLAWVHMYLDEYGNDARAKYDHIVAMNIPVVFDQTPAQATASLPDNMMGNLC